MADESNQLRVRLVTPERILFEETAASVELPAKNGYMEVLYGHAPLLAELGAAMCACTGRRRDGGEPIYNVSWGFVEVLPDRVTILANDALKPEEINVTAPTSSSTAATRCGTRPARAKRPTTKRSMLSLKPKPNWLQPRRSIEVQCVATPEALPQSRAFVHTD